MGWIGDVLGGLPPLLVLAVVAALVTFEVAVLPGVVLPAATALIATGLLANAGIVPIVPALLVAVAAALLGGQLAFCSGRRRSTVPPGAGRHRQRAERLFTRHGGRAVFLGQWVVGARTLVPRLAGRNGIPYRRFAAWHTPAATLWALWMVGASYAAGASYDVLAARAGRAAGALAAMTMLILGLTLAVRWFGQHPDPVRACAVVLRLPRSLQPRRPAVAAALSLGLLTTLAVLLIAVIPPVVRFSGLAAADQAVAAWAHSQWTSDGLLFALETTMTIIPEVLVPAALVVSLVRWWRSRRTRRWAGLPAAIGPVLPAVVLAAVFSRTGTPGWQAAEMLPIPAADEFDGMLPPGAATAVLSGLSAGQVAQTAAAAGLLAWLIAQGLPWSWQSAVWTTAAAAVTATAGSWVYLGWSRISETVAAVLLGVAWAALNAAVWSAGARSGPPATAPPSPELSPIPGGGRAACTAVAPTAGAPTAGAVAVGAVEAAKVSRTQPVFTFPANRTNRKATLP